MTSIIFLGRLIFGAYFIYLGVMSFKNEKKLIRSLKEKKILSPRIIVLTSGVMLLLGGAGVFLNILVEESAIILLLFMIPVTFIMHPFWKNKKETNVFLKNLALIGALLMLL
ncbi:MAG: DoxX family membrane protein [Patescibacteria group bacterium]|nr:DoxX family membrane protein [Patescibacteria group bacterium]